jgi:hypothetical protein
VAGGGSRSRVLGVCFFSCYRFYRRGAVIKPLGKSLTDTAKPVIAVYRMYLRFTEAVFLSSVTALRAVEKTWLGVGLSSDYSVSHHASQP